ncbi:MAG: hypothetical protein K6B67_05770 [Lachnospiraceae bacterium]|nr:hypothetical protein [Lachnospiraceae bacterium]
MRIKSYKISNEDIDDIVCTAFEGGINYWCNKVTPVGKYLGEYASEQISRNGSLILHLIEPINGINEYELNKEKLIQGLTMYLENPYAPYEITCGDCIDTCNVDADVADMIIQYALFKEIVLG